MMIPEHFEEWIASKLLSNFQLTSLIIMDNASYHSRHSEPLPVMSWTKKWMQDWPSGKGTEFFPNAHKVHLTEYDNCYKMAMVM